MPPKGWKKPVQALQGPIIDKPKLGLPDPLEAAQEACRLAQEGNVKLCRGMDIFREALEMIVMAEFDHGTGKPVDAAQLRKLAEGALNGYSALSGQNWKLPKNKLSGATRAGDRSMQGLEA